MWQAYAGCLLLQYVSAFVNSVTCPDICVCVCGGGGVNFVIIASDLFYDYCQHVLRQDTVLYDVNVSLTTLEFCVCC